MRTILLLGHNDLRLFFKSKTAYIWLFAVPIIFIGFMGYAFRGPGNPANARPTVRVNNQDTNFLGAVFMQELGTQGMNVLGAADPGDAPQQIRIPPDFTRRILAGNQAKVDFSKKDNDVSGEGAMVELRLLRAVIGVNWYLLTAASANGGTLSGSAIRSSQAAPATVRLEATFAGRKPTPTGFRFSLPGNMVMYVMMNLLVFGGASMARQRAEGLIRRLAVNPVTRGQMVAGKIYGLVLLGGVQVAVFLMAGQFLFGVRLGANLGPVLLTLLVYSWVAASFGVLAGSVARSEDKVIGLCVMVSLVMAALGGCWWPLEIGPPILKVLAHGVPTGWALDALHQLISFGGGLHDAIRPITVLTGFGLAANVLAARFFKW